MGAWVREHKTLVSNVGLVLILLLGASYLVVSIMRINPFRETYNVTVNLDRSGGIQPNNDVTYRGFRVGKVNSLTITDTGVAAEVEINKSAQIPAGGVVSVQALSAAGEQYIDFQPESDGAPYLEDGDVIEYNPENVKTPPPLAEVLNNASTLINQVNPEKFRVIVDQLDIALAGGSVQLQTVMKGISETAAGLDSILPQTTGLVANLRTIMGTTSLAQPDLGILTQNSDALFAQLSAANAELNAFLDAAPGQLSSLGGVVDRINDPVTNLAGQFDRIFSAGSSRAPALAALFPALRDAGLGLQQPYYNNEFHVMADIWVRPSCQYAAPMRNPTDAQQDQRVYLYKNYCINPDPTTQVRGSANAPRPNVPDNTSGPPPGITGDEMSIPEPGN